MSNYTYGEYLSEYPDDFDEYLIDFDEDYFEELTEEGEGQKCNYCYGTGLDREEDADCLVCYGEGYL